VRRMVEKILSGYGSEIRIQRLGTVVFGFLQPVRGKGQNMVLKEVGPLGQVLPGQYVYIGPAEPEVLEDDILELEGRAYVVRRAEQVSGAGGPAYQWGMCVQRGGGDAWGSSG